MTSDPSLTPESPRVFWKLTVRFPYVTVGMIVLCVVMFGLQMLTQIGLGADCLPRWAQKFNSRIMAGEVWRLFTPMLLHGSLAHIFFNMYALYSIGPELERQYGHIRYAMLMLLGGFAGNVFSFLFQVRPSLGASTAIFGLIAAQGVFFFQNRAMFRNAGRIITNTLTIVGINLFIGLSPGIDNWGHLGGLLGGLMFALFAGPIWQPITQADGVHIVNQIDTRRAVLVAALVGGMFGFLALAKMIGLLPAV